ncbi:UDP-N-acetylmuramoyl-L-alanyl-D-glutamate--2,6-diaminopimelate ligase [Haloferula luteola]|uniref:UDP-N-acetylmuramoyl-L-alanyl-D-glutamate--2,6-diaminopimelate ligase n=1 Tax=Haloferula luteola TaxID=595692 RepID=A0A840V0Q9_9BACT|nr:UDP-N-acetylmuramoyl-L-alanyl-D-glutamate--2,6-diaminopimelate ligase [Haloferula luteola]MBB5351947.1 UDP-N-acetylmuramoyl-L-alanyl-D-glutamate--2,6-diaminopimelate ligase [Haloferula luteola]
MMKLRDAISQLHRPLIEGTLETEVTSVTADSRTAGPGSIFVAIRGQEVDGRRFIDDALRKGAVAVVTDSPAETGLPENLTWIHVGDPRAALSSMAAQIAGNPSAELKMVGVTGTNGKTTTAYLLHALMRGAWHRAGMIGTVKIDDGLSSAEASHTTPDAPALQNLLLRMRDHGCRGAVMEVSSHGIDQKRVADVAFDALVFTNLTQDHLDYHGTMAAYAETKFSWFEAAALHSKGKKPVAVINTDDAVGEDFAERLEGRLPVIRFGFGLRNEIRALDFRQSARGMEIKLEIGGKQYLLRAPLIGRFNAYNLMGVIGAAKAVGIPPRVAIAALAEAPQVPGRMEHCGTRDGVSVFVDYAHTPDALENACRTLKELEPKRLITVFGCGGDRDKAKRPLMARAAGRFSDACIITSDNPRSEDPAEIIRQIEEGMGSARYRSVEDRAEAIRIAVHAAAPGDIVLVAGKGHETYQQFADQTIDFDDRREVKRSLAARPGPEERKRR